MDDLIKDINNLCERAIDGLNEILDGMNLTSAIKAQIDSGIKGDGTQIRPTYTQDPFFKSEDDAYRWIDKYNKFLSKSYPEWGLPARDTDTPNLNITGTLFFDYITADTNNGYVEIQAIGSPIEAELRAKYGDDILSLSPQVKSVIDAKLEEELKEISTNLGFRWDADV